MTTVNLTKPESTYDAIRKSHKDLKPTDAALVATALVEAGKFATCIYDGKEYRWSTEDHQALVQALLAEVNQVQLTDEQVKVAKTKVVVEETATLTVVLRPNMEAAESILGKRKDLKTMVSDMLAEGVEFLHSPTDLGWPWTLERVNWSTMSSGELRKRIKFRAEFEGNCEAGELSQAGKRKK